MGLEIERKFLLKDDSWRKLADGIPYKQGYLSRVKERTVRIRITGDAGYLTIKGPVEGATRSEYEYEIPIADARVMLDELCEKPLIEKKRYKIEYKGLVWEIDEFFNENQGLVIAEVELKSEGMFVAKPRWIGEEVTTDERYFNANLIRNPFRNWFGDDSENKY